MSAQARHTPGPWDVFEGDQATDRPGINGAGMSIVIYGTEEDDAGVNGRTREEATANAHLIAAAPDLLAELINLRARFHRACLANGSDAWAADAACAAADAAIARAEGRAA